MREAARGWRAKLRSALVCLPRRWTSDSLGEAEQSRRPRLRSIGAFKGSGDRKLRRAARSKGSDRRGMLRLGAGHRRRKRARSSGSAAVRVSGMAKPSGGDCGPCRRNGFGRSETARRSAPRWCAKSSQQFGRDHPEIAHQRLDDPRAQAVFARKAHGRDGLRTALRGSPWCAPPCPRHSAHSLAETARCDEAPSPISTGRGVIGIALEIPPQGPGLRRAGPCRRRAGRNGRCRSRHSHPTGTAAARFRTATAAPAGVGIASDGIICWRRLIQGTWA